MAAIEDGGAADRAGASAHAEISRYTRIAILLHWIIGVLIIAQLAFGFWLANALESADQAVKLAAFEQTQIHKSVGLTILALSVLRLAWRLANPAPPLPEGMSGAERAIAALTHVLFYGLMIGLPLTGWAMVSSSVAYSSIPTIYFGLFEVPHLPLLPALESEAKAAVGASAHSAHFYLALGAVALLALHVGAALKHHFVNRDGVLARMAPGVRPIGADPAARKAPYRGPVGAGRTLLAVALVVGLGGAIWGLAQLSRDVAAPAGEAAVDEPMEGAGMAQPWGVVHEESAITFLTANSGAPVEGKFESWKALIEFDSDNLEQSEVVVIVDVVSATTGDPLYDGSMSEPDWFDADAHPKGTFVAKEFVMGDGPDAYVAKGSLTLRGVEKPFDLPFTLVIDGGRAEMSAEVVIDRAEYGIGVNADPDGAWVPLPVTLKIDVVALKAN